MWLNFCPEEDLIVYFAVETGKGKKTEPCATNHVLGVELLMRKQGGKKKKKEKGKKTETAKH